MPNSYFDLNQLIHQYHPKLTNWPQLTSEEQLTCLEQIDFFRKPERFTQLMLAAQTIHNCSFNTNLDLLWNKFHEIDYAKIAAEFKGSELSRQIHLTRLKIIRLNPVTPTRSQQGDMRKL